MSVEILLNILIRTAKQFISLAEKAIIDSKLKEQDKIIKKK